MILIVPKSLQYLTEVRKMRYKDQWIKSVHLLHIIHRLIYQWTFDKNEIPHYSPILQKLYGMRYHLLLEYLIENEIIVKTRNYSTENGTSNEYKLKIKLEEVLTYQSADFVFNKKHRIHWEERRNKVINENSPIPITIRSKILDDLHSVTLKDFEESVKMINKLITHNPRKYIKNLMMITSLSNGDIFWEFDDHGRFHSNLTSLMKEVRDTQLLIDGEPVKSIDIKTSQPFFLVQIMKKEWLINDQIEFQHFIRLVETRDLYDHFINRYPDRFKDRKSVKPMVFRCLFDEEPYKHIYKELFKNEFPEIYEFLQYYHVNYGESLWKTLQRMESELIYGNIYQSITNQFPYIKLFTVHDSIHFQERYHDQIKLIWDKALTDIINH
jgi:hypothetical protein